MENTNKTADAETLTTDGVNGTSNNVADTTTTEEKITLSKAEYVDIQTAIKRRDEALKARRELEKELETIKQSKRADAQKKAEEAQDLQALKKFYETDLEKAKQEREDLQKALNRYVIEGEVRRLASGVLTPEGVELFLQLNETKLEARQGEDGKITPRTKESGLEVSDLLQVFKDKYQMFVPNPLKQGTGVKAKEIESKSVLDISKFNQMTSQERRTYLANNPEIAKKLSKEFVKF
jgi:hypothetical protein